MEIFGLNIYRETSSDAALLDGIQPAASPLVVIEGTGSSSSVRGSYMSGETPIVIVRSVKTGDAKACMFKDCARDAVPGDSSYLSRGNSIIQGSTAWVELPDGQIQQLTALDGVQLLEVVAELDAAVEVAKREGIGGLGVSEQAALKDLTNGSQTLRPY